MRLLPQDSNALSAFVAALVEAAKTTLARSRSKGRRANSRGRKAFGRPRRK